MTSIYRRTRLKKILVILGALLILGGFVPRDSYAQSFGRVEADLLRANGAIQNVAPEATAASITIYSDDGDDAGDKFSLNVSTANVFSIQNNGSAVVSVSTAGVVTTASTVSFLTSATVTGASSGNASLILDADNSDDAPDAWTLRSTASGNALDVINDTTAVVSISTAGAVSAAELSLTGAVTSTGVVCVKSNGALGQCTSVVDTNGLCTCS